MSWLSQALWKSVTPTLSRGWLVPQATGPLLQIRTVYRIRIDKLPKRWRQVMKLSPSVKVWRKNGSKNVWFNEGDHVGTGKTIVTQGMPNILPGLNVKMIHTRSLVAAEDGEVMFSMEKTNLNFDEAMVQTHFSHLGGNDSHVYRPYVHVIPYPQSTRFRLVDAI